MIDDSELKREEELKRERMLDPVKRWEMLMQAIAWADAQQPIPRNSITGCKLKEARLLAGLTD